MLEKTFIVHVHSMWSCDIESELSLSILKEHNTTTHCENAAL